MNVIINYVIRRLLWMAERWIRAKRCGLRKS